MSVTGANEKSLRSVFVGNIPYDATEEKLTEILSEVGPIVSFKLVYDRETGKPKGYGFCEYKDQETALSAMRNLSTIELYGRTIKVDAASSDKSKEELKLLQESCEKKASESVDVGRSVEPSKAPEAISKAVASLPPEQMFELMKQMKICIQNNPQEARNMLLQNPQLAYALLQAQVIMKIVDPKIALALLHRPTPAQPPHLQPSQMSVPGNANSIPNPPIQHMSAPPIQAIPADSISMPIQNMMNPPTLNMMPMPAHMMPVTSGLPAPPPLLNLSAPNVPVEMYHPPPMNIAPTNSLPCNPHANMSNLNELMHNIETPRLNPPSIPIIPSNVQMVPSNFGDIDMRSASSMSFNPGLQQSSKLQNIAREFEKNLKQNMSSADKEKAALIMQVLQLSDDQISSLPLDQQRNIMILKEQISKGVINQ